ncbi:MAG: hypothetical protein KGI72_05385 [Patescibacteria group bacterium]|nr:hypothetical protein [Patescibacteria group bacterium]MDE2233093.1 hypothetical protein [Patescibacteria group bacterium]
MDEKQIQEIIRKSLTSAQYRVGGIPYHVHNGTDSPQIPVYNSSITLAYLATITIGKVYSLYLTTTAGGGATININARAAAGQTINFLITNDATANRTITFGAGFKPSGTLVGTTSKSATVSFVSDGIHYWETSRTTGL